MQRKALLSVLFTTTLLAAGCRTEGKILGSGGEPGESERRVETDSAGGPALMEEADQATLLRQIRSGELEQAHATLEVMLTRQYGEQATFAFNENRPEDGLVIIDRALALAPDDQASLYLKAKGSLGLAEKKIADGGSAGLIEGALADALEFYQKCEPTPETLLGASRTATLLGSYDEAVTWAQRACESLTTEPAPGELSFMPERVLSEASFRAYTQAKQAEEERASDLFLQTEDALGRLLGRTADDPWAWATLADLNEWEERYGEAQATLQRGLARMPEDAMLLERLVRVARKSGGSDEVIAVFAAYNEKNPDAALSRWYGALERFESATQKLMARFDEEAEQPEGAEQLPEDFRLAEEEFRRTREIEPEYEDSCRGYEVMCRNAIGWTYYQDDELEAAEAAFQSMNEVVDRGLEWKIEGRLLSGVDGLHLVGTRFNDLEDWASSARVYGYLHGYQPENDVWANNTGFFYRDAAVEIELTGKRLCRAAGGDAFTEEELALLGLPQGVTPEALTELSNQYMQRARELMTKSWEGYKEAARLAPDDVRVVNDAGLVLVYYLHANLDEAKRLLLQSVAAGEKQLADETLEEDARWELKNAWGDAHQNLGVMYAIHEDAPQDALRWFEKSVEIGPEPRPTLSNFWIPLLRGEIQQDRDLELYSLRNWGAPCTH